jgi:hypothetical protein
MGAGRRDHALVHTIVHAIDWLDAGWKKRLFYHFTEQYLGVLSYSVPK